MVGLTSVFRPFGNSLQALSQPLKYHLWSSTKNLGTSSDMLLSLMHFPLQQVMDLQSPMMSL
jgi:hypothetical protein